MRKNSSYLYLLMKCGLVFLAVVTIHVLFAQRLPVKLLEQKAPATFKAVFKTTKGNFTVEAYRDWSPLGVDRLYQLIVSGFYNNNIIMRVEHKYVIQFGISDDPGMNYFWDKQKLKDEPIKAKHRKGIVAFARDFANSRTTQLFINSVANPKLDTIVREGVKGYTPIGKIISGMDVIASFNGKYGRAPLFDQDSIYRYGNKYLNRRYPGLDKILSAEIVK